MGLKLTGAMAEQRSGPAAGEAVLQVRGLTKRLGAVEALRDVTFTVHEGESFVIMGPSGAGKSVLLKHLVGLLRPDAGEIVLWGLPVHDADEATWDRLRTRIGVVFQSAALFDSLTVGENVAFPLRRHRRLPEAEVRRIVAAKLRLVDLEGVEDRFPAELSGGMRKRVGIARALALDPELILYDEPTGGLDPLTARAVDALIARLRAQLAVTSVIVTHDLETAFGVGDRLALLWEGRLVAVGPPPAVAADPRPEVQSFLGARAQVTRPAAVGPR